MEEFFFFINMANQGIGGRRSMAKNDKEDTSQATQEGKNKQQNNNLNN